MLQGSQTEQPQENHNDSNNCLSQPQIEMLFDMTPVGSLHSLFDRFCSFFLDCNSNYARCSWERLIRSFII